MRGSKFLVAASVVAGCSVAASLAAHAADDWRAIPLVENGKIAEGWEFTGYGSFKVEDGSITTVPDARGLGLLFYEAEKFGDCRLKVVYRSEGPRSNSGVYVRIDEGIKKTGQPGPASRDESGELTAEGLEALKTASEKELGPWYAVHHGFEVQICDAADEFHRTGAVYSLAGAKQPQRASEGAWKTMIITLKGDSIDVSIDGSPVSHFDGDMSAARERKIWHEPKRDPQRPRSGYIGLQTHDPGDVVSFKEIAVAPLE